MIWDSQRCKNTSSYCTCLKCRIANQADTIGSLQKELVEANARIAELEKEIERLIGIIADPQLLSAQVDQNAIDISMRPREEIMRHLFLMCAHAMGESKNFVECTFGPDEEGRRYVVTLRHYLGKTPGEIADEKLAEANARIAELEKEESATSQVLINTRNLAAQKIAEVKTELEEARRREEIIRDPAQAFVDWVLSGYNPELGEGGKLVRALRDGLKGIVSNGDEPIKYGYPNTCPYCNANKGWLETIPPQCIACKYVDGEYP